MMKTLGTKSPIQSGLQLAVSMAVFWVPATAAPELSMTRSDGSEVIRTGRVVTWGRQIGGNVAPGTSFFENVTSVSAANDTTVVVLQNGSVGVMGAVSQNEVAGAATLTNVKAAVRPTFGGKACRTDGSVIEWSSGAWSFSVRPGLTGVTALSAGTDQTLALKDDGTVVAWGSDFQGVGLNQVPAGLSGVVAIDSSYGHNVALKSDGTVVAWGQNASGQCNVPAGLTGVTAVSAGEGFTIALKTDGSLVGWGNNTYGQLTPPADLGPASAIATGSGFTAALKSDKTVALWGHAGGYGTTFGQTTFPPFLGRISALSCGSYHTSVITDRPIEAFRDVGLHVSATKSFTIHNTGADPLHLGNIVNSGANAPDFVLNLSGWTPVLAPGASTTFGVTFTPSDWGLRSTVLTVPNDDPDESDWDLALTGNSVNSPPLATTLNSVVVVEDSTEGVEFDLPVVDPNGHPMTFTFGSEAGYDIVLEPLGGTRFRFRPNKDFAGQKTFSFVAKDSYAGESNRGYVTITVTPVNDPPVVTVPREAITAVATSPNGAHVSFMLAAGDIEDGLLQPVAMAGGQPVASGSFFSIGEHLVQASVTDSEGATVNKTFTIRVVVAPAMTLEESGVELKERGILAARGSNFYGQTSIPSGISEVVAIAAGQHQSMVVLPNGTVRSWGSNYSGVSTVPAGLSGVIKVATSGYHALALKADGTVVGWGSNSYGQATPPPGLTGVTAIAAGETHSLALKSDGTVVAWGSNVAGETTVPAGLDEVVGVAAGWTYSLALRRNGSVVAWGEGNFGQHLAPSWLAGAVGISKGQRHCLAWRADGTLVGWGSKESDIIVPPAGLGPVVIAAAGTLRSTVIQADGKVIDWGGYTPLPQTAFARVKDIVWGESHVLATEAAPALCTWGSITAFVPPAKIITVRNSGSGPLDISGISVEGGLPGEFLTDLSAMASTLAPGASTSFVVNFFPKLPGLREAKLRILSNDFAGETREVLLSGTWVNSPPVVTSVGPLPLDEDQPGGIEITLPASDANGNAFSLAIVTPPPAAQGSLGPISNGKVVFTPALDYHGPASFTFKASDGFSESTIATVSLTVLPVNDAPRLTLPPGILIVPTLSGGGAVAEFIATAHDPEEGRLSPLVTVNGVPVTSSSIFPLGDTVVVVTATDLTGKVTTSSFIVRVQWGPDLVVEREGTGALPKDRGVRAWGRNSSLQTSVPASLAGAKAVAAGREHSLALRSDGTVVGWGSNSSGQSSVPASLTGVVAVAAGSIHSVALKGDGTVVAWGSDFYGQRSVPAGLADVTAICAGDHCTLALRSDGTVVGWGRNDSGQISIPEGLENVIAISAGSSHGLALKSDGTVVAWGSNTYGEASVPAGLAGVKRIAAGGLHSLALRHDGSVVAWGYNNEGQATVPSGLAGITEIAAGAYHSLALNLNREVVGWGRNIEGQSTVPADPGRVEAISAGGYHSLALVPKALPVDFGIVHQGTEVTTSLTLRNQGPRGLDIGDLVLTSGNVTEFTFEAADLDEHLDSGESTPFVVKFSPLGNGPKRAILTIRSNDTGNPAQQLALIGHGRNGSPTAVAPSGISVAEDTAAGVTVTLAASDPENDPLSYRITSFPTVSGTLGAVSGNKVTFYPAFNYHGTASFTYVANDGGSDSNPAVVSITVTPVNDAPTIGSLPAIYRVTTPLAGGTPVTFRAPSIFDVEDGNLVPQFRLNNGTVVGSGSIFPAGSTTVNVRGTDSGGTTVSGSFVINVVIVPSPALQLESPAGTALPRGPAVVTWSRQGVGTEIPPELRGVKDVAAGGDFGLALRHDGTLLGWGSNTVGQLSIPSGLLTATKIRCGSGFALALRSDGTVVAWGSNSNGQVTVPAAHSSGISDLAAGSTHAVVCKSDGTVAAWGNNTSGQSTVPSGLAGVRSVAAGTAHTLALKTDGTVIGWGSNNYGQRSIPAGLSGVLAVAAGGDHSLALKSDGTVVAWGRSWEGQTLVPPGLVGVTALSAGGSHSMALKSDGSVAAWGSYSQGFPIAALPAQVARVASIASGTFQPVTAVDHPSSLNLGAADTGGHITRTITVRNRGSAGLNLAGITKTEGSGDFTLQTSTMAGSVATGQTTSFSVVFTPTTSGTQSARFRIASNDRYESGFDIVVTGEGVPPFRAWAAAAGLDASGVDPEAVPHGDGVASLLKYAFNMNGAAADSRRMTPGTGTAGLPSVTLENGMLTIEFVRRKSGDLVYTATRSPSLESSSFVPITAQPAVTDIDATWERVVIREAVDLALTPRLFGRVEVRMK